MVTLDDGRHDGAISPNGQMMGAICMVFFASDSFRGAWLQASGHDSSSLHFEDEIENGLNDLADHLEAHADIENIAAIAGIKLP